MKKFNSKQLITRIIAFVVALSLMAVPVVADDIEDLEEENANLSAQIAEEEARIAEIQNNIDDLESYIRDITDEMDRISGIIDDYEDQKEVKRENIDQLNNKIDELEAQIADKEADIDHQYELMKMRIKFLYENVDNSYFEAIFSSGSFSEAVEKIEYLLEITTYDRRMMKQIQDMVEDVNQDKAQVESEIVAINAQLSEIDELESAQQAQQDLYEQARSLKEIELEERHDELDTAQMLIDEMSAAIAENEGEINSLIAAYEEQMAAEEEAREARRREAEELAQQEEQRRLAEQERAREEARQAWEEESRRLEEEAAWYGEEAEVPEYEEPYFEEVEVSPEDYYDDSMYDYGSQSFIWPLNGYGQITSYFGYRGDDPDLAAFGSDVSYHQGIDIYAPDGTPILAAADGIVVVSRWSDSIGYMMAVYHGNGVFTEMHHMNQLSPCGVGETVYQGQVIGYVGSTGYYATGSHLHFGVCVGSDSWALTNYVDPLAYL